jgi:hypothetical protein
LIDEPAGDMKNGVKAPMFHVLTPTTSPVYGNENS